MFVTNMAVRSKARAVAPNSPVSRIKVTLAERNNESLARTDQQLLRKPGRIHTTWPQIQHMALNTQSLIHWVVFKPLGFSIVGPLIRATVSGAYPNLGVIIKTQ